MAIVKQIEHDPTFFDELPFDEEETTLTDEDIIKVVNREIELAEEYVVDELEDNIEQSLDYYFGRPRGDEVEGRSEAQSLDFADMVEATLAEIMPLYSAGRIAKFTAVGEGDEDQAQVETEYCNQLFMEQNQGYTAVYSAVKDALMHRNAIVEVYCAERVKVEYDEYVGVSPLEIQQALMPEENVKKTVTKAEVDDAGKYDVVVKRKIHTKELVVEPVEPGTFLFATNHRNPLLIDIRFCSREIITSKSELISSGYDPEIVAKLKQYDGSTSEVKSKRNQSDTEATYDTGDDSTTLVQVYRSYVQMDYDKDGIAELHMVISSGDYILDRQFVKFVGFASGTAFIMPHRFPGVSLFDKLKSTQDQKTAFIRQYIDNATTMNNRRLEVLDGQVNLEDVLNSRPGGVVRSKIKGAINPIPVDDIGPSCITALEYLDKVRAERGGSSLDMQSAELQLGGNAAHATERQYGAKEKLASLISRTIAETLIKQVYILIHATLREYFNTPVQAKIKGVWQTIDPSKWQPRELVKIDVGMSMAERQKRVQALSTVLDLQIKALELDAKDVLTNLSKIHNTLIDLLESAGIDNHDRYWIDPKSPDAVKALKLKQQAADKAQKAQEAMQTKIFEYQKTIEDNKDQIQILKEESKQMSQLNKQMQDMQKHNDEMRLKWAELEEKYNVDVPGEGING